MRRLFGWDVVYSGSVDADTWAIFTRATATIGQYGEVVEPRITAQLPLADVPDPQPGDTLETGDLEYIVDQVVGNDGYLVEVVVRLVA